MREKKFNDLVTPFEEKLDKACPFPEYPRPQLKRDSYLNLNGEWDYALSFEKTFPKEYDGKILVPFPVESRLSGVQKRLKKNQYLYYHRTFTLPEGFLKARILLHIDAVDQLAEIYLNGQRVGSSENGYLPVTLDITPYLQAENRLEIQVLDNLEAEYPHGKQRKKRGGIFYTEVSGIWGNVWLESVPDCYIKKYEVNTDIDNRQVTLRLICGEAASSGNNSGSVNKMPQKTLRVFEEGKEILRQEFAENEITFQVPNPILWSPETPFLYEFTVEMGDDFISGYFAMRKIRLENNRLLLNNQPYFLNGILDQGYFSDGIYLPATYEGFEKDIRTVKELGFNTLRKHIKIEPLYFYYLCDRIGMLVVQDMVNNSDYSFLRDTAIPSVLSKKKKDIRLHRKESSRKRFEEAMIATVKHLRNTPSIIMWTIFNEGWGQHCSDELYEKLKHLDATRIVDSTSGWWKQKKSDVESLHIYSKPIVLPRADKPCFLSEFGAYVCQVEGHIFNPYKKRTLAYQMYGGREEFQADFLKLYEQQVLPNRDKMIGCIYTQLSDVEDETNGLLTYDRQVLKVEKETVRSVMKKLLG